MKNTFLSRIIYVVLLIFPCGLSLILSLEGLYYSDSETKSFTLCMLLAMMGILYLIAKDGEKDKQSEIIFVISMVLIGFCLRHMATEIINTYPASDSEMAYTIARKVLHGTELNRVEKYFNTLHWGTWAMLLRDVMKIFGEDLSVVRHFCILVSSMNCLFLYIATKKITKNQAIAKIAMVLYVFSPGMIVYAGCLTNVHVANSFLLLFFIFLTKLVETQEWRNKLIFTFCTAISLAVFNLFKIMGSVLILAVIGAIVLYFGVKEWKALFSSSKSRVVEMICFVAVLVMVNSVVAKIDTKLLEKRMGIELYQNTNFEYMLYSTAYVGLNFETGGRYEKNRSLQRRILNEVYKDVDERSDVMKEMLLEDLKKHKNEIDNLLWVKFGNAWGNEENIAESAFISTALKHSETLSDESKIVYEDGYKFIRKFLKELSVAYWIIVMFGACWGAISHMFGKRNFMALTSSVFLFGFALILEIMETSPRYKEIAYFSLILLAAYGYKYIYSAIWSIRTRKNTKTKKE